MKSLLPLAILAALAVATLCYESHESMESYEISPFINRRNANTFMSPQQRWRAKAQERVRERNKPAHEINREACDDYKLCERYAMVYGYNAAYNRYFRQRRGAKY
ncbi:matrix Gla protein [Mus caroli]|uniref:Matrix Gla protein n=1 Tax=Mus caroli TaxID=10089 RepID=A0A6P5PZB8_MUSCR|nr:matrix Gla protein [Mus caroli]